MDSSLRRAVPLAGLAAVALLGATLYGGVASAGTGAEGAPAVRCADGGSGAQARQDAFESAGRSAGVPPDVLLAVSYLQSRWDDHDGEPSAAGGYGPMHLTEIAGTEVTGGKDGGDSDRSAASQHTLRRAAQLTGLDAKTLRNDPAANVCGGAAVLAAYQRSAGAPTGTSTEADAWADAIRRYATTAGASGGRDAFVRDVYTVLRDGMKRRTSDGQRIRLDAHPDVRVPAQAPANPDGKVDCPKRLGCEWIPAPYEQLDPDDPTNYGNHDLANRPQDLSVDYIVIHDTEGSYQSALDLVTDPTYLAWNYTIRSGDGHIAQHLDNKDVGWHAGNWYVNAHSIGIEHEGHAATGATWFTESMYRSSARLVRHLGKEYGVPLDRAHIIGHDQVPGTTTETIPDMHWDTGPYWDWEHYMELMDAPIGGRHAGAHGRGVRSGDVVTVKPGFEGNEQPVTGCEGKGEPCTEQSTNFVYLRTEPDEEAPLVSDIGLFPDGRPGSTEVADISARATAGTELSVEEVRGDWLQVWWLGEKAWLKSPESDPVVVRARSHRPSLVAQVRPGADEAPTYGRAYPEAGAYPDDIDPQDVSPLPYTLKPGQEYVVADARVATDYYHAEEYGIENAEVVRGHDRYLQIWLGHRYAYVRAADVMLTP